MNSEVQQLSSLPSVDADYRFGRPKTYLAPHELARLTILRSKLGDTQAERAAEAAGTRHGTPARVMRSSSKISSNCGRKMAVIEPTVRV